MHARYSIFHVLEQRIIHSERANSRAVQAAQEEQAKNFIARFFHAGGYEQVLCLQSLKSLAILGCSTAQKFYLNNVGADSFHDVISNLLLENFHEIAYATEDARFLFQLYTLLIPKSHIFNNVPISNMGIAIEALELAAQQTGPYATHAALYLAYLYAGQIKPHGEYMEVMRYQSLYSLSELFVNFLASPSSAQQPESVSTYNLFAKLGCADALRGLVVTDINIALPEEKPHARRLPLVPESLEKLDAFIKDSYLFYFNLAMKNLARFGLVEMTCVNTLETVSYFIHIYGLLTEGQHHMLDAERIYASVKQKLIYAAQQGQVHASFFLGFAARHGLPNYAPPNANESSQWFEHILQLDVPFCETVRWVGRALLQTRGGRDEELLKKLHQRGCADSAIDLCLLAVEQRQFNVAYRYFQDALTFAFEGPAKLDLHNIIRQLNLNDKDIERVCCVISIYALCIKANISPVVFITYIRGFLINLLGNKDLEYQWLRFAHDITDAKTIHRVEIDDLAKKTIDALSGLQEKMDGQGADSIADRKRPRNEVESDEAADEKEAQARPKFGN